MIPVTHDELRAYCNDNIDLILSGETRYAHLTELMINEQIRKCYIIPYLHGPIGMILNKFCQYEDRGFENIQSSDWITLAAMLMHVRPYLKLGDYPANIRGLRLAIRPKNNQQLALIYKYFCRLTQKYIDNAITLCLKHASAKEVEEL